MIDYRLFRIKDGHFTGVEYVEAEDDESAVRTAAALAGGHPAELWCADRLVTAFPRTGPGDPKD